MSKLETGVYGTTDCEIIAADPDIYPREVLVEGYRDCNQRLGTAYLVGAQACASVIERFEPVRDSIGQALAALDKGPGLVSRLKGHFTNSK